MMLSHQGTKLFPIVVFILIWGLQIVSYLFSPYEFDTISGDAWTIISISVFSVVVGYLTYYFLDTQRPAQFSPVFSSQRYVDFDKPNLELVLKILTVLAATGVIGDILFLAYQISSYGLEVTNIYWYRHFFTGYTGRTFEWSPLHSFFSYLITLNEVAIVVSGIYFSYFKMRKLLGYGPIFLALLFSIVTLQRFEFISSLVLWLGSIFFSLFFLDKERHRSAMKKLGKSLLFIIALVVGMVFSVIIVRYNIRLGGASIDKLIEYSLRSVYSYFSGNIVALNHLLQQDVTLMQGGVLSESILKWLERLGLVPEGTTPSKYQAFTKVGPQIYMNTYTYIRVFYADFGLWGLMPLSYAWGMASSMVIHSLYRKFRLYKLVFSSMFLFSFFISFFGYSMANLTKLALVFAIAWGLEQFMVVLHRNSS